MFVPGAVAIQKWNFPLFLVTNVTLEWATYAFGGLFWNKYPLVTPVSALSSMEILALILFLVIWMKIQPDLSNLGGRNIC